MGTKLIQDLRANFKHGSMNELSVMSCLGLSQGNSLERNAWQKVVLLSGKKDFGERSSSFCSCFNRNEFG